MLRFVGIILLVELSKCLESFNLLGCNSKSDDFMQAYSIRISIMMTNQQTRICLLNLYSAPSRGALFYWAGCQLQCYFW